MQATTWGVAVVVGAMALAVLVPTTAGAAVTGPGPVVDPPSGAVTADALPTAQIDGVVWSQATAGNIVYAGGKFANARPAGAAPGTNLTPRGNLLAYDITTGVLVSSFAPTLNAQVNSVATSPDGTRVYVGGQFTTANGANRYRIAAYSTATGALLTTFAPQVNATVHSIVATNSTVYVGGIFSIGGKQARTRLAAFNAADGALLPWNPSADGTVTSLVVTPSGSKVIVGGNFANVNGQAARGLAAVDAVTGATLPWAITSVVQNSGQDAGITDLSVTGSVVYGSGYVYGGGSGNLEGTFAADAETGRPVWIAGCHGDSYGITATASAVYVVSHSYNCSEIGGFGLSGTDPQGPYHRTTAFTPAATGTASGGAFNGMASPSMINWFPDLAPGKYTGITQAGWSVTATAGYVAVGGEFPKANGVAQQGLVRFVSRPTAPSAQGPRVYGTDYPVTATVSGTSVAVSWGLNWDRDDTQLTYKLVRDSNANRPVFTSAATTSTFWTYQAAAPMTFTDTGLTAGTHTYKVVVSDPSGYKATSAAVTVTVPAR